MLNRQADWQSAHEHLSRIARELARIDDEEGTALVRALRSHAHFHLGYATFAEYIERLFGYRPRWTEERLRVAQALEGLPELQRALRDGIISWSAARELTRVATAENEHAWLESSRGQTVRQIEQLVAGHQPGDGPDDARERMVGKHVLRLVMSADTIATFREAMCHVRRASGTALDEDAVLLLMARCVLAGPSDEGRSSYQVAVTVCEECKRGYQQGRGEAIEIAAEVVAMANCDAQDLGLVTPHPHVGNCVSAHVGSHAGRRVGDGVSAHVGSHAGPDGGDDGVSAHVGSHAGRRVGDGVSAHVGSHAGPDGGDDGVSAHAVSHAGPDVGPNAGEHKSESARTLARAHQSVPPAVRRSVLRRDGGCCVVPGCRHATFLDVHHVVRRADGGDHDADALVTLCSAHHRALHRGHLVIEGRVSTGLVVRHADGSLYGRAVDPQSAGTCATVFAGLRRLGFRENQVRQALGQLQRRTPSHAGAALSFQVMMRDALALLTEPPRRSPASSGAPERSAHATNAAGLP